MFPQGITHLGATATAHGITSKHILVSTETGQVISLPLKIIDPRRPVTEPSSSEKAEGLAQYTPVIPALPIATINYYRTV